MSLAVTVALDPPARAVPCGPWRISAQIENEWSRNSYSYLDTVICDVHEYL